MKICMVGQGAFAKKHLDGLARIKDAEVVSIYGRTAETTKAVAEKYHIPHWTTDFDEALAQQDHAVGHLAFGEERLTARRVTRRSDGFESGALAVVQQAEEIDRGRHAPTLDG